MHKTGGTPGRIRTPNLLVRSQTLCPVELRAHLKSLNNESVAKLPIPIYRKTTGSFIF